MTIKRILLIGAIFLMTCLAYNAADSRPAYQNDAPRQQPGLLKTLKILWDFAFHKPANTVPGQALPVQALTREQLLAAPDNTLFRLGHSTILMKLNGEFWLTDPVFSKRASPVQWAGPARFHAPPISIAELPPIKGVILSHNHYDHLDYAAIRELADKTEHFLAPLGVGDTLVSWGVPVDKVRQLAWWESASAGSLKLTATPAQHFSGRTLWDSNKTLWASWVIESGELKVFFSGDTGYFKGFKEIGERFGPFDLTLMETGAYDPQWPDIHMQPKETMQAHIDLRGKVMLPIHNGTFDLAMHSWDDPFEQITALAAGRSQTLATPMIGEALNIAQPQATGAWWRLP
jgi:L-ascorbate metabolism protein UlaG (beta-lactamase superfamily)